MGWSVLGGQNCQSDDPSHHQYFDEQVQHTAAPFRPECGQSRIPVRHHLIHHPSLSLGSARQPMLVRVDVVRKSGVEEHVTPVQLRGFDSGAKAGEFSEGDPQHGETDALELVFVGIPEERKVVSALFNQQSRGFCTVSGLEQQIETTLGV